jgi:hypothetical protein
MLVRNISTKAWHWPYTEDGTPDRVEPGEEYWIDVPRPPKPLPGEPHPAYRLRLDEYVRTVQQPWIDLVKSLREAGMMISVVESETCH